MKKTPVILYENGIPEPGTGAYSTQGERVKHPGDDTEEITIAEQNVTLADSPPGEQRNR